MLRREHLAGRLDDAEFEDRTARCLRARTYADLDALIAGFARAPQRERTRFGGWRPWPVMVLLPLLVAAVVDGHGHLAWLIIPFAFFAARPLLWRRSATLS